MLQPAPRHPEPPGNYSLPYPDPDPPPSFLRTHTSVWNNFINDPTAARTSWYTVVGTMGGVGAESGGTDVRGNMRHRGRVSAVVSDLCVCGWTCNDVVDTSD